MLRRTLIASALSAVACLGTTTGAASASPTDTVTSGAFSTDTVIIPRIFEDKMVGAWQEGRDTEITMVLGTDYRTLNPGGSAASLPKSSEEVYIYLFERPGNMVLNDFGKPICNPCTVPLGGTHAMSKRVLIQDLLFAGNGGTWPKSLEDNAFQGYAVLKARGDLYDVAIQADFFDWSNDLLGRANQLAVERLP